MLDLDIIMIDIFDPLVQVIKIPVSISGVSRDTTDVGPRAVILAQEPALVTIAFTLYGVDGEVNSLYSISYDLLEDSLSPISPLDGAFINVTMVTFSARPVADEWEFVTEYRVRLFDGFEPSNLLIETPWRSHPMIDVHIPEGYYSWTMVYRRFNVIREADWLFNLTVDTTPPRIDPGGPYLNAVAGLEIWIDASDSSDNFGISLYQLVILKDPPSSISSEEGLFTYIPSSVGQVGFQLHVTDHAGNIATTSAIIFARPPVPVLELVIPNKPVEGVETDFSCIVENPFANVTYSFIWQIDGVGGLSSQVIWTFPDDGTYDILVEVWDSFGQRQEAMGTVTVSNAPPSLEDLRPITIIEHDPLSLDAVAHDVSADPITYRWSVEGEIVSEGVFVELVLDDGDYEVTLAVEDDSGASNSTSMTLKVLPIISDIYIQVIVNETTEMLDISWSFGEEPDFKHVDIIIALNPGSDESLATERSDDPTTRERSIPMKDLPDEFYVWLVLSDNSITSQSSAYKVVRPMEPVAPEGDDQAILAIVALLALISIIVTTLFILERRKRLNN